MGCGAIGGVLSGAAGDSSGTVKAMHIGAAGSAYHLFYAAVMMGLAARIDL
jgi:hypothetical protein